MYDSYGKGLLCDFYVPALVSLSCISLYFSLNVYIISHVRKVCGLLIFSLNFFLNTEDGLKNKI